MTPDTVHAIFELLCQKLLREEAFPQMHFVEAFELESRLGISLVFIFCRHEKHLIGGADSTKRITIMCRFPIKFSPPRMSPKRLLCDACSEFLSKPISTNEVIDMVRGLRKAQSFDEMF